MSQPTLFLMLGYPGAGKTTASKFIKNLTGAEHLWADKVRRQMYDQPTYSHAENMHLYTHLNDQTCELLRSGKSVIFDTNFSFYKDRQHLHNLAKENGAKSIIIWVKAPLELAKQRAVEEAHLHTGTRLLGHMPLDKFKRITHDLEEPKADEELITLDGTQLSEQNVRKALEKVAIL